MTQKLFENLRIVITLFLFLISLSSLQVVLKRHSLVWAPLASPSIEVDCLKRLRGMGCVIELLDYYKENDELVMVLEYPSRCCTLYECLTNHRHLPVEMTWQLIIAMIANALLVCKDKYIVYRGLEPKNVLLCASGGEYSVKLLDFEDCIDIQSKFFDVQNGGPGKRRFVYPEEYRSPEQDIEERDYDQEAAQVYALGRILHDMVKNGLVRDCSAARIMWAHMTATNPELRPTLESIVANKWLNGEF